MTTQISISNLQQGNDMVDNPLGGVAWEELTMSDASLQGWEVGKQHMNCLDFMAAHLANQGHPRYVDEDEKHMRLQFRNGLAGE